jgi:hypothetical protein
MPQDELATSFLHSGILKWDTTNNFDLLVKHGGIPYIQGNDYDYVVTIPSETNQDFTDCRTYSLPEQVGVKFINRGAVSSIHYNYQGTYSIITMVFDKF